MRSFIYYLVKYLPITLIVSLISYILVFPLIIPSYKQAKDLTININSWNADNDVHSIEKYFIELGNYDSHVNNLVDKNGILYRLPFSDKKKYIMKPGIDSLYVATDMSRSVINLYTDFINSKDSIKLAKIDLYSKWLLANASVKDDIAIWPYQFKFTKYDLDFDWCGAWALGNILSALSRKIALTNDSAYHNLGEMVVNTFNTKIESGGILYIDENNNYWFEEYPSIPPSHVLNGHINGLLGLYDFWRISGNKLAHQLFFEGINTVKNYLNEFDSGYWSYYDLQYPYVGDYFYHKAVHIPQLKVLYQITKDATFKQYAEKWQNYFYEPYFSIFKLKMIHDGLHRRMTYKSFFTLGK